MLARIIWFVVALVILGLAFFFLAAAIVVGAVLAAVLLARIWWINRRMRKAAERQVITTDYSVVEREPFPQQRLPDNVEIRTVEDHPASMDGSRRHPPGEAPRQ